MATHNTNVLVSKKPVQSPTSSLGILKSAREQTGFDSYHAYLQFHNEDTEAFAQLCGPLRPLTGQREETIFPNRKPSFQKGSAVLNLSEAGQLSIDESYCTQDEEHGPGTDMAEALCFPPADTRLQIAIWDTSVWGSCEVFGDLIGLHYQLDPVVLSAIDASRCVAGQRPERGLDRFAITHAKVGQIVATLLHPKNGTSAPPLVFIAGPLSILRQKLGSHPCGHEDVMEDVRANLEFGFRPPEELFETCPPFNKSSGDDKKPFHLAPLRDEYKFYPGQLNRILNKYNGTGVEVAETFLLCLLPILQLSLLKIRYWLSVSRNHFENPDLLESDRLYNDRALLRTLIDDMESDWWCIRKYMKSSFHCELSELRCYQDADNDVKDFVEEASRLEGRLRDHLQLQTGIKALEESKKSIEVSNQQIQEVKT
ncbi:MAG: hypothetical protein Q9180_006866, partial [Flavoplaca navasiana]